MKEVDKNGEFFFFGRADFDNTKIQVGSGRADIVTDCANLCAMSIPIEQLEGGDPHDICTGFAIDGDLCTLLYPGRTATAEKPGVGTPFIVADNTRVYNIEECIAGVYYQLPLRSSSVAQDRLCLRCTCRLKCAE